MSFPTRQKKITVGILFAAGALLAVALVMASKQPQSSSSLHGFTPSSSNQSRPQVDVVFVLDTTGSMSGLIEGAKRKIWSIANQIQNGQPRPEVRLGLVGYRDLGDAYVTRATPLSEAMEDILVNLSQFRAEGGGDTAEHVNKALAEAIRTMQWREGQNVLRQIYLVGDALPHDGREGLFFADLTKEAKRSGIVINTVRCGEAYETETAFKQIASLSGGIYSSVAQDGHLTTVATPYDEKLAELNAKLSATLLPTGSPAEQAEALRRRHLNASMDQVAQAESAAFRARSGRLDRYDLLSAIEGGKSLDGFAEKELPPSIVMLSKDKRPTAVSEMAQYRKEVHGAIEEILKKRDSYLKAKGHWNDSLHDSVGKALKAQGSKAKVRY